MARSADASRLVAAVNARARACVCVCACARARGEGEKQFVRGEQGEARRAAQVCVSLPSRGRPDQSPPTLAYHRQPLYPVAVCCNAGMKELSRHAPASLPAMMARSKEEEEKNVPSLSLSHGAPAPLHDPNFSMWHPPPQKISYGKKGGGETREKKDPNRQRAGEGRGTEGQHSPNQKHLPAPV